MIIQMKAQSRVEPPGVECATKLLEIYPQINEPPNLRKVSRRVRKSFPFHLLDKDYFVTVTK